MVNHKEYKARRKMNDDVVRINSDGHAWTVTIFNHAVATYTNINDAASLSVELKNRMMRYGEDTIAIYLGNKDSDTDDSITTRLRRIAGDLQHGKLFPDGEAARITTVFQDIVDYVAKGKGTSTPGQPPRPIPPVPERPKEAQWPKVWADAPLKSGHQEHKVSKTDPFCKHSWIQLNTMTTMTEVWCPSCDVTRVKK